MHLAQLEPKLQDKLKDNQREVQYVASGRLIDNCYYDVEMSTLKQYLKPPTVGRCLLLFLTLKASARSPKKSIPQTVRRFSLTLVVRKLLSDREINYEKMSRLIRVKSGGIFIVPVWGS